MRITVDEPAAWCAAAGGFIMNMLVIGYLKSIGLLMLKFQNHFGCSNTLIMFTTASSVSLISGLAPLHSLVTHKFVQLRHTAVGSGLCVCISMIVLYNCFHLAIWAAFMGVGMGACLSLVYSSVICRVGECFEQHRDLANGVTFAGSSAGAVLMPLIFSWIVSSFSPAGCCLLIGGYFLHLTIVGLLMPSSIENPKAAAAAAAAAAEKPQKVAQLRRSFSRRQRALILIFCSASAMSNLGFVSQYMLLPMYVAEHGVSQDTTAIIVAAQGACDLVSRLLIGCAGDRCSWRKSSIMMVANAAMGASCLAMVALVETAPDGTMRRVWLFAYAAAAGASGGAYMTSTTAVIVSFFGIANLSFVHSLSCLGWALLTYPGQTLLGFVKDVTGSYRYSTAAAGSLMLLSAACLALERLLKHQQQEEKEQQQEEDVSDALHASL